ncbi:MAG: hypothetical protein DRP35_10540 [Candidatus Zixiibacteriota bacterium]|nr:MAG: hypothetical protein DRP35_10540 [candidate division Zixibacteria bacterium]
MVVPMFGKNQSNTINPDEVYRYIIQNIGFELPFEMWLQIDSAFSEIWNNKIGIGGYFYWDEFPKMMQKSLFEQKILISNDIVTKVTFLILKYIEKNNGFLN